MLKNLLAQPFVLVTVTHPGAVPVIVSTIPSDGVARVVSDLGDGPPEQRSITLPDGTTVPISAYAPPSKIDGLPDDGDIIVAAQVADAMRLLGLRHRGQVYSPMLLVYRDGKPVGSPGLIWHRDLALTD